MRKKLADAGGFSLMEMLCAVVVLSLLCMLTGTGIQMAMSNYFTLVGESETQLLLSTLSSALSDKLRYAVVIEKEVAGAKTYTCSIGTVKADEVTHRVTVDGQELLPNGAYGPDGRYQVEEAAVKEPDAYAVGVRPVYTVSLKIRDTQTKVSKEAELIVRCLNPVRKEEVTPP